MRLENRRLSDVLGAEVRGLPLRNGLDGGTIAALNDALLEHHLLCLRSEPLAAGELARLARSFGEPQLPLHPRLRHPDVPEVALQETTYRAPGDRPEDVENRLFTWHTDDSFKATPAKLTLLQGLEVPERGGETRFCNTRLAYEELPLELRARVEGLRAVHRYDTPRAKARPRKLGEEEARETPEVIHPLIRTHEETGAKAIYLNPGRTDRVEGSSRDESDALLDRLERHITDPRYRYDHVWRQGDILIWDNRCLIHSVNGDFAIGAPRVHQRILLRGGVPY